MYELGRMLNGEVLREPHLPMQWRVAVSEALHEAYEGSEEALMAWNVADWTRTTQHCEQEEEGLIGTLP